MREFFLLDQLIQMGKASNLLFPLRVFVCLIWSIKGFPPGLII